ncbi:hypothetical protein CTAYLR_004728 [Chrysophaeum taylorii]|uniref:Glycosyltransferase 2-like domain-containing protein n=1 Tax=Chrysophaeum taylorii TaxID=2483200 RepID=A0AAD7U8A4_9STRA|nr:hypothetical protein CTAYLR_004728 [Chrysophaeum taylorii]
MGSLVLMATSAVRVAVCVVTFERPQYLSRCVEQIARQRDLSQIDVIIVDDSTSSCKGAVEAGLGCSLEEYLRPARLVYDYSVERRTIGAKRTRGLSLAADLGCEVIATWDDDDVYGDDRVAAQAAPIIAGDADATLATPEAWRWETDDASVAMSWGNAPAKLAAAIDPRCELGLELVDEAIASLCFRVSLAADLKYPDLSYDEDRLFFADLKRRRRPRCRRLPPGRPSYVHVKHPSAAAAGPLTRLYAANLGVLASPAVALPLVLSAVFGASRLVAGLGRVLIDLPR